MKRNSIFSLLLLAVVLNVSLVAADDQYFDSNGVRIRFIVEGKGEPIVLIHGLFLGLRAWVDNGIVSDLARDHQVIAFDWRGTSGSDKPQDASQYGTEMGLDVVRLLDHLGISKAHVVGYSLGADVAHQLLASHPSRFKSAILVAGTASSGWAAEEIQQLEQEAEEIEQTGVSRSQARRNTAPGNAPPTDDELRERGLELMASGRNLIAAAIHRSRRELVVSESRSAEIATPILGMVGSDDGAFSELKQLKRILPAMQLVVVDGATHAGERGILRRPEFLSNVRQFLAVHSTVAK